MTKILSLLSKELDSFDHKYSNGGWEILGNMIFKCD